MYKRVYVTVMLVSLLLLASCGGGSKKQDQTEDFLKGTRGLDIKLADPAPIIVPSGQPVYFDVIFENMGREYIEVYLELTGFDSRYLQYPSPFPDTSNPMRMQGKGRYGPGDQTYVKVQSDATALTPESHPLPEGFAGPPALTGPPAGSGRALTRLEQPTTINACYKERTQVQIPVCVDLDPLRDGPCPTEQTISLENGQGAPVGISMLNIKSYRKDPSTVRLNLDLTFEQFDISNNAQVFNTELTGKGPCDFTKRPDIQTENDVKLEYNYVQGALTCPGLDKQSGTTGFFDLERRPTIRCYADIPVTGEALNTVLDLTLEYWMWHKVTQPIVIEQY